MNEDKRDAHNLRLVRAVLDELIAVNTAQPEDTKMIAAFRAHTLVQLSVIDAAVRGSADDVQRELAAIPLKLAGLLNLPIEG